jgi:Transposase, Mutator family
VRHKERNVLDHLPERERPSVKQRLRRAWALDEHARALDQLRLLAGELDRSYPGAAGSLREGMEETLTLTRLGVTGNPKRTLESTNPCESMLEIVRRAQRNVKRWSSGEMALRWTAAGMLAAERQFRRIIGYRDLATLVVAIERGQQPSPSLRRRAHPEQGGRYRPHRLTITPGPPPKIHGARNRKDAGFGQRTVDPGAAAIVASPDTALAQPRVERVRVGGMDLIQGTSGQIGSSQPFSTTLGHAGSAQPRAAASARRRGRNRTGPPQPGLRWDERAV